MSDTIFDSSEVIIKNTFLEFTKASTTIEGKRSSSLPRSFKPAGAIGMVAVGSHVCAIDSDDGDQTGYSTDYEDGWGTSSNGDSDGSHSDIQCEDDVASTCAQDSQTLMISQSSETISRCNLATSCAKAGSCNNKSRSEAVTEDQSPGTPISLIKALTTLSTKASSFKPSLLSHDTRQVITAVHAALTICPQILSVQLSEGGLGSATTIVGSIQKGLMEKDVRCCTEIAKMALLNAARHSEKTYVMGYNAEPFMQLGWSGFSAKLVSVPDMQSDTMCWDAVQYGFCSRRSTCRWCHPCDNELIKLVVVLQEV